MRNIPKQYIVMAAAFALLVTALAGIKYWQIASAMSSMSGPPPQTVSSMLAQESVWDEKVKFSGSLSAVQGVTLKSEVSGQVAAVAVQSGQHVKAGQLIIEIDSSVESAELKSTLAQVSLARINLTRAEELLRKAATSQSNLDSAKTTLATLEAESQRWQALINKKSIRAPFDGQLGIRNINIGDYVSEGQALIPLHQNSQLYVDFWVPERYSTKVKIGQAVELTVDHVTSKAFSANVSAIDPQVDTVSRNIRVQAHLQNDDGILRPGMFVTVLLNLGQIGRFITLPITAIVSAPYGESVYVIEGSSSDSPRPIRQQFVKTGKRRGEQIAIIDGLQSGQEIVTSGAFKLAPGMQVLVNNSLLPGNSATPSVQNS